MIDFASMKVGDSVKLEGSIWEHQPRATYNEAQEYVQADGGAKQFEVSAGWKLFNGVEVREYTLTRIR